MSTRTTDRKSDRTSERKSDRKRTDVLLLIDAVIDEDLEFLQEAVW